jgi:hypothetical protein
MCSLTLTAVAVTVCVVLAVFRGPRWLLVGAVVGVGGYTISRRTRVP